MPITGMGGLTVRSSLDGSQEPSLFYRPRERIRPPLLVGLHTWSCDLYNQVDAMLPMCRERGWALLLPEFRGPNLASNPRARQACASALAKQDIIDVVDATLGEYALDADRVFLLGAVDARLLKPVVPGDQLFLQVVPEKIISTAAIVRGEAEVDGRLVAKAKLTFAAADREALFG